MQKMHVEGSFPTDKDLQSLRRPFVLSREGRWMGGADEPPEVVVSWNGVFIPPAHWKAQSTAHYTFRRLLGRSMARRAFWFLGEPDRCEPVSQSAKVPLHFATEMQSAVSS